MWHIINALILRELKTRFGKNPTLGYIQVIFEPMMHIIVILTIISLIKDKFLQQIPFILFLISGMVPFFMFRSIINFMMNGIEANKSLFTYKPVRPIHVFLARALLEGILYFVIFCILMITTGFFINYNIIPFNIVYSLLVFIWLVIIAFALGLLLAVVFYGRDVIKNIIGYALTMMYFGSAIMFPLWIVPNQMIDILAYNPILHIIELFKENYFETYPIVTQINIEYPLICTLVLLFFSLGLYYKKRVELGTA
ncbi:ABC transporter permease [Campylobacter sp. MG1]|uniref:capsule polysaccharide transporter KpsM n=1 Tax=Campylobacter sp. MG1 TaxID=2976332 RepID=UPI00226CE2EB|nr:ABC transporter permease [Campylobacter sp. MG1]